MSLTALKSAIIDVLRCLSPLPPALQSPNHSRARSGTSPLKALESPIRSATKRPSDDDDLPAKRQKTAHHKHEKPIYRLTTVFLKLEGIPVAEIPLKRFRTLASEKAKELTRETFESATHHWKLYSFIVPRLYGPYAEHRVKEWASWLIHGDLRAVVRGDSFDDKNIDAALVDARDLSDVGYQDALVDALMVWILEQGSPGSIDTRWLRRNYERFFRHHDCLKAIGIALIWHYDSAAVRRYDSEARSDIRQAFNRYLHDETTERKDPLEMSADDFCDTYHSHHEMDMPCYRTKGLPRETSPD